MTEEILYMLTIHNPEDKRIGLEISGNIDQISDKMKIIPKTFGDGFTAKLWECHQISAPKKD